jgi:hypothetical protein
MAWVTSAVGVRCSCEQDLKNRLMYRNSVVADFLKIGIVHMKLGLFQ